MGAAARAHLCIAPALACAAALALAGAGTGNAAGTPLESPAYHAQLFALLQGRFAEVPPTETDLAADGGASNLTTLQDLVDARRAAGTLPSAADEMAALTAIGIPASDTQRYYWYAAPGVYWPVGPIGFHPPPGGVNGVQNAVFHYGSSFDWSYKGGPSLGAGWTLQFTACSLTDGGWLHPTSVPGDPESTCFETAVDSWITTGGPGFGGVVTTCPGPTQCGSFGWSQYSWYFDAAGMAALFVAHGPPVSAPSGDAIVLGDGGVTPATGPPAFSSPTWQQVIAILERHRPTADWVNHQLGGSVPSQPVRQSYGTCTGRGVNAVSPSECLSDPVNSLTGAYTTQVTDASLTGIGLPFAFTRSYTSADPTQGRLGIGWTDGYSASLAVQVNGDVVLHGEDGQQVQYSLQPGGSFIGAGGARSTLTQAAGGYELIRQDQVRYRFGAQGRLTSMVDRNGRGVTLAYTAAGDLASITDSAAQRVTFSSNPDGTLSGLALPGGETAAFGYAGGQLSSVTGLDGKTTTYRYDAGGRLDRVTDPNGHVDVENTYGTDGRVSRQVDGAGQATTFAWDPSTETEMATDPRGNVWKDVYSNSVLTQRIDPLGHVTSFEHDRNLNATSVGAPDGSATAMTYDQSGNVVSMTPPPSLGGAQKTFAYDVLNNVTSVTDGRGTQTTYEYDAAGNPTKFAQAGQVVAQYSYDPSGSGELLTSTDGRGNTTSYAYDGRGNVVSVTDPAGGKTTYTYDDQGRVLTLTDPLGNVQGANPAAYTTTCGYDAVGRLLSETDPLGNGTTYTYDAAGNRKTLTDPSNHTTVYDYDSADRLVKVTAPDGGITTYSYDAAGNQATTVDPRGNTTTDAYDASNRLVGVTDPLGNKTTYRHDANGQLATMVDPRGNAPGANPVDHTTTYVYDVAGRLRSETDPLGNVTSYAYDAVGEQTSVTDPNGHATLSAYDGPGRLSRVTAPDGGVTAYTYDAAGNRATMVDPRGNTTTYGYDPANRLASVTDPLGDKTTFTYDANGDRVTMVDPRGNVPGAHPADYTTRYGYDADRRLRAETDPLGDKTVYAYDAVGNKASLEDANHHSTGYRYDPLGRLSRVTAPDGGLTASTYDAAGNQLTRTDANNHTTSYAYDAGGRLTSKTSPTGQTWTYGYDPAGNRVSMVDANGNASSAPGDGTATYTYDRAGRLTAIGYSDATPGVRFSYDGAGNRLTMVDGAGTVSYAYDAANRPTQVSRGVDTFAYQYDPAGDLTRRTDPDGTVVDYAYDNAGRLAAASSSGQTTSYAYDPAAHLQATTLPSGTGYVETRAYDGAGRLIEVTTAKGPAVLSRFAYTLDPVGNPLAEVRSGAVSSTTVYGYDASDRLTSACFQVSCQRKHDPFIRYSYDTVGNRLSEAEPKHMTAYLYNAADQLTRAGSTSYSYDQDGNQTRAGSGTFAYDLANRLLSVTSGKTTTAYSYDGDGNRLTATSRRKKAADATSYLWDTVGALPQLALERDGAGGLVRRYVYGARRISLTTPGGTSYYAYDSLGSVVNVISSTGTAHWTYAYEPFGTVRAETKNDRKAPDNPMKFTGELYDPTGLYYLRARQYDPASGRFLSIDPVEAPDAVSSYAYTGDRPTVMLDPSGQTFVPVYEGQMAAEQAISPIGPTCADRANWKRANVVREAMQYLGVPYVWGGKSPRGFDCSGLVTWVYAHAPGVGVSLPGRSQDQAGYGIPVARSKLLPGDLITFNSDDGTNGHIGIYIGGGRFIHAPHAARFPGDPNGVVRISSIVDDRWYSRQYNTARRIIRCDRGQTVIGR